MVVTMESAVLEKEALRLSNAERALLADKILESLSVESEDVRRAWAEEAERRLQAYEEGREEALDGPSVVAELRERHK